MIYLNQELWKRLKSDKSHFWKTLLKIKTIQKLTQLTKPSHFDHFEGSYVHFFKISTMYFQGVWKYKLTYWDDFSNAGQTNLNKEQSNTPEQIGLTIPGQGFPLIWFWGPNWLIQLILSIPSVLSVASEPIYSPSRALLCLYLCQFNLDLYETYNLSFRSRNWLIQLILAIPSVLSVPSECLYSPS